MLFEADQRGVAPADVLARVERDATDPLNPWVRSLVDGVVAHQSKIDELIATYSEGWPIDRMPAVDRALSRIGVYEILFEASVPDAATIDEVVTLAGSLSTDESPAFLNGLLARISNIKQRISLD